MPHDTRAAELVSLHEKMAAERLLFEAHWRDVSELVMPTRSTEEDNVRGRIRTNLIYDNTAQISASRLAAELSSRLVSASNEWFILQPLDPFVEDREADLWMEMAQQTLLAVFRSPSSGFYPAAHEAFLDLSGFGTCAMFTDSEDTIRYTTLPLSEVFFMPDHKGRLRTLSRLKRWSAVQAMEKFGKDNLSRDVIASLDRGNGHFEERDYVHIVLPRDDVAARMINFSKDKPFASVYIDKAAAHIVSESGFDEFPYAPARWKVSSGEIYGTSPAIDVMDEIRLINIQKKTHIVAMEKAADPPLQVEDEAVIGKLRTMPGGVNYIRRGSPVIPMPTGDPRIASEAIAESRAFIQRAFFEDILRLPLQDRMTATEVVERRVDDLQAMAPYVSRVQEELLSNIISRTLAILIRNTVVPAPPDSLVNSGGVRVEYVSPLAVSQRASRIQAVDLWVSRLLPLAQINPSALNRINTDELPKYTADVLNVPPQLVRSDEEINRIRELESEVQRLSVLADIGERAANVAKTTAEAQSIAGRIGAA